MAGEPVDVRNLAAADLIDQQGATFVVFQPGVSPHCHASCCTLTTASWAQG
jgi:hypothetical protein